MALRVPGATSDRPIKSHVIFFWVADFFYFPPTFVNRSPALILDLFNVRIARVRRAISTDTHSSKDYVLSTFRVSEKAISSSLALPKKSPFKPLYLAHTVA